MSSSALITPRSVPVPAMVFSGAECVGPVLADVVCPDGSVHVTVDPEADVPRVQVRTAGITGPAADAVRGTVIWQQGEHLTVTVPPLGPSAGHDAVTGGPVLSSCLAEGTEVQLTLPAGSGLVSCIGIGSLRVTGTLAALEAESGTGDVRAESIGHAKIWAGSGRIVLGTVMEWVEASTFRGAIEVADYQGRAVRLRTDSGTVTAAVHADASGRIEAATGSGDVTLHGVRGRCDLDVRAFSGRGVVRKL